MRIKILTKYIRVYFLKLRHLTEKLQCDECRKSIDNNCVTHEEFLCTFIPQGQRAYLIEAIRDDNVIDKVLCETHAVKEGYIEIIDE